jgi:carbonic anhydrase/acetyltransferase-like protein (isoleucine patch superfamily)
MTIDIHAQLNKGSAHWILPRIAPGAYIGPNTTIVGPVTMDIGVVSGRVTIRATPSSGGGYIDHKEPLLDVPTLVFEEHYMINDGVAVHNSAEYGGIPGYYGKNIIIGHNNVMHGAGMADGAVAFLGSSAGDGSFINRNAVLGAGSYLNELVQIPADEVWGGTPAARIRNISQDMRDRKVIVPWEEYREHCYNLHASNMVFPPDENDRQKLNLSKLLYAVEAAIEIIETKKGDGTAKDLRNALETIERYYGLHPFDDGQYHNIWLEKRQVEQQHRRANFRVHDERLRQVQKPIIAAFKELATNREAYLGTEKNEGGIGGVRVEDSCLHAHRSYTYDSLHYNNIMNFLALTYEKLDHLEQVNEFGVDTGIQGPWYYYGMDHRHLDDVRNRKAETDPKKICQIAERFPVLAGVFIAKQHPVINALCKAAGPTSDFTRTIEALRHIRDLQSLNDQKQAEIGGLLLKFPDTLRSLNVTALAASYQTALDQEETTSTKDAHKGMSVPQIYAEGKLPRTIQEAVSVLTSNFETQYKNVFVEQSRALTSAVEQAMGHGKRVGHG